MNNKKLTNDELIEQFDPNIHYLYCNKSYYEKHFEKEFSDTRHIFILDPNNFLEEDAVYLVEKKLVNEITR